MPRVCYFTGKKTTFGNQITHRGKAKYLGGVGTKITSGSRSGAGACCALTGADTAAAIQSSIRRQRANIIDLLMNTRGL